MVLIFVRDIDGAYGRNWPGVVFLSPRAPLPAATLAQELWEAEYKMNPVNLLRTRLDKSARRAMEIMGHEVEVQAAAAVYGRDKGAYRLAEAASMHRGYDGIFARQAPGDIAAAMAVRAPEAARWVQRNIARIRRYTTL